MTTPHHSLPSPQLILVDLHDLALQFEALFGKQFEVADVVSRVLVYIVVAEFSYKPANKSFRMSTTPIKTFIYDVNSSCLINFSMGYILLY